MVKNNRWDVSTDIITCRRCFGSGEDYDDFVDGRCPVCRGKGEIEHEEWVCNWCGCIYDDCDCDEPKGEGEKT